MHVLLLLLCLLSPSLAHATIYYVATTGNDTTGDGSVGNPWRNPGRCFKSTSPITAGDTCMVGDGTYRSTDYGLSGFVILVHGSQGQKVVSGTTSNPIIIKSQNAYGAKLEVPGDRNAVNAAIYLAGANFTIEGFDIDGSVEAANNGVNSGHNGINIQVSGTYTIRNNKIHHVARTQCSNAVSGNSGIYSTSSATVSGSITGNTFYSIGRLRNGESSCTTTEYANDHGMYLETTSGLSISHNICYDTNRGYCFQFYQGGHTNLTIVNNTFADKNESADHTGLPQGQIVLTKTMTNVTIANNIFYTPSNHAVATCCTFAATNVQIYDNLTDIAQITNGAISGVTLTGNATSTSPGFTNAATRDYTLAAGSAAIDTGTAVTGFSYNGTNPDKGAYETFAFSTCSVANATASVINTTFENNVFPPLLPSTGVTTFTARKAGANDVVTGVVRTGDNQLDITVTNAFVAGNAIDISWASGNLTDSSPFATKQPFLPITNSACTNNVGGSPSHLFIQARFEFHDLRGTEAAPVVLPYSAAAENTNINVMVGGKARLRIAITCSTADCPATGFYPFYACAACTTAGTYTLIPNSFATDEDIALCGTDTDSDIPISGTATTDQLSTAGTFVAGALVRTSSAIPTIDLAQNNKTELEYCIAWDTDAVAGRAYTFRVYKQDSTAIDTYTVTPQATVRAISAGLGF